MKKLVFLGVLLGAFAVNAVFAQSDLQPAAIVRLTKSEPISVKQFRTQVETLETAAGRTLSAPERRMVLDNMINERLATQAAERDKITVSDTEVNQQVEELRAQISQSLGHRATDAEFSTAVRQQTGLDLPAFRDQARKQIIVQKYLIEKKRDLINGLKAPTDADIQNEYNLRASSFTQDETIQFTAILVPYTVNAAAADKTKAKTEADRLAREIGGNVNKFDELVQKGQTPGASYRATTSGVLRKNVQAREDAGQAFMDAAFALPQAQVSSVLEIPTGSAAGYYIIKVTGKYPQKFLTLDDMILEYNTTVRNYIGSALLQQRQQEVLVQAQRELVEELRKGNPFQIFENNISF